MMQWFINEVREKFVKLENTDNAVRGDLNAASERIKKLEGELMALKARLGKKPAE